MAEIDVSAKLVDEGSCRNMKISDQAKISNLLEKLDKNLESVVVKRNGMVVTEEEELSNGDEIEVVPIVSGG